MNIRIKLIKYFYSIYVIIYNTAINLLPDDFITNQYLRASIAQCFGMKCGKKCYLRKKNYYIYPNRITLGDYVNVGGKVYFDSPGNIIIGNNVGIGYQVTFTTGTHKIGKSDKRMCEFYADPIIVQDGCWIGARSVIGPGVIIGKGCIVSAGSVVMRNMPPDFIVSGNPARPVQKIEKD